MSAQSTFRGNRIEFVNDEWVYSDTGQPTVSTHTTKPCGKCGKRETADGHDACLGTLRCVMNACCGHGHDREAYVVYENGTELRGLAAVKNFMKGRWR